MAKDVFYEAVKQALLNDGWSITSDPYILNAGDLQYDVTNSRFNLLLQ